MFLGYLTGRPSELKRLKVQSLLC